MICFGDMRVREPVNQSTTQQQTTVDQRREQGKKDNQVIDDLRQQVNDSNGISPVDKAVLTLPCWRCGWISASTR